MNRLVIAYWREWRPSIYRWTAAISIFVLFALAMEAYFNHFDYFR